MTPRHRSRARWQETWLVRMDSLRVAGGLPTEVVETVRDQGASALRYLRPVLIAEPCLACHRERARMQPAVLQLLDARYPGDRATGYYANDLRGVVSVRVPIIGPARR